MTEAIADKALTVTFQSPSKHIKIEFQGGEPLLNFGLLQYIVLQAEQLAGRIDKNVEFVVATNLAMIDAEMVVATFSAVDAKRDLRASFSGI